MTPMRRLRLAAVGIHLLGSAVIAALVVLIITGLWYPWPYRRLCGGLELLGLVVGVDLFIGPLLTLVVFNFQKPRPELIRDLGIIVLLQVGALIYGLYTIYQARPVLLVFEVDRFRAITPADVYMRELPEALPAYRHLSLTGPKLVGTRAPRPGDEQLKAFDLAAQGVDIGQRPLYWQPYDLSRATAVSKARPVKELVQKYLSRRSEIDAALKASNVTEDRGRFLPVTSRKASWVTILDSHGNPGAFLPLDGFF